MDQNVQQRWNQFLFIGYAFPPYNQQQQQQPAHIATYTVDPAYLNYFVADTTLGVQPQQQATGPSAAPAARPTAQISQQVVPAAPAARQPPAPGARRSRQLACVHCRRSHVACGEKRPCRRCDRLDKHAGNPHWADLAVLWGPATDKGGSDSDKCRI